jgi:hypothetical protein
MAMLTYLLCGIITSLPHDFFYTHLTFYMRSVDHQTKKLATTEEFVRGIPEHRSNVNGSNVNGSNVNGLNVNVNGDVNLNGSNVNVNGSNVNVNGSNVNGSNVNVLNMSKAICCLNCTMERK